MLKRELAPQLVELIDNVVDVVRKAADLIGDLRCQVGNLSRRGVGLLE